jgi:hypothetical protein
MFTTNFFLTIFINFSKYCFTKNLLLVITVLPQNYDCKNTKFKVVPQKFKFFGKTAKYLCRMPTLMVVHEPKDCDM